MAHMLTGSGRWLRLGDRLVGVRELHAGRWQLHGLLAALPQYRREHAGHLRRHRLGGVTLAGHHAHLR